MIVFLILLICFLRGKRVKQTEVRTRPSPSRFFFRDHRKQASFCPSSFRLSQDETERQGAFSHASDTDYRLLCLLLEEPNDSFVTATITFENLSLKLKGKSGKVILEDVTGVIPCSSMCAIMGPSGIVAVLPLPCHYFLSLFLLRC